MIGGSGADFYPRSPCGERPYGRINDISRLIFLSTLSLRRATVAGSCLNGVIGFLSTLSLRRATSGSKGRPATQAISIHALLAESDLIDPEIKIATERFLSTLSLRRATNNHGDHIFGQKNFYPRSPCGERRPASRRDGANGADFYPRSPCGERPEADGIVDVIGEFLSTLSLRRATPRRC